MNKQIELEQLYNHSVETVWHAIAYGASISRWFIQADFEPIVGYRYTFTHDDTIIQGELLTVNPPHQLEYSWEVQGMPGSTTVRWLLEPAGNATRLRLVHDGFETLAEETAVSLFTSFSQGWQQVTGDLATYLEQPANEPISERL